MASNNLKEQEKQQQEALEQKVSSVEKFFNENRKIIWGCLGGLIVIGLAILGYNKFYVQPKTAEAQEQMYPAETAFSAGSFEVALQGDGNNLGFSQIIDEYGARAGKSVYLYAGICALNLGDFQSAVSYLDSYKGKDEILAAKALACKGDAYVGLEDYRKALNCFEQAAAKADNIFAASYLLKAARVCEELGDSAKALSLYKRIKDEYPQSIEGYDVDKYISRIENAE